MPMAPANINTAKTATAAVFATAIRFTKSQTSTISEVQTYLRLQPPKHDIK
jgi:hypothetical protein